MRGCGKAATVTGLSVAAKRDTSERRGLFFAALNPTQGPTTMARRNEPETILTPSTEPTPEAPAEAKPEAPKEELSYPPDPKTNPQLRNRQEMWRQEKRVKCCHKKCCYPLNIVAVRGERTTIETPEDGPAFVAVCSWDKRHVRPDGSPQFVLLSQVVQQNEDAQ